MIDLSSIARQLHLSVDQLRFAADLIDQGMSPAYISRYRGDETGSLSKAVLWRLKLHIERQKRLRASRERIAKQIPKEVSLDSEATKLLEQAQTVVAMESALKSFRARRALDQSQERDGPAGRLLEKMITYTGPSVDDVPAWVSAELSCDSAQSLQILGSVHRLISSLIHCDTDLIARLRHAVQRKANIRVTDAVVAAAKQAATQTQPASSSAEAVETPASVPSSTDLTPAEQSPSEQSPAEHNSLEHSAAQQPSELPGQSQAVSAEPVDGTLADAVVVDGSFDQPAASGSLPDGLNSEDLHSSHADDFAGEDDGSESDDEDSDDSEAVSGSDQSKAGTRKSNAKMTPRQRRRRWLVSMLSPLKSLKKPVQKLTAFQHLMLGRGVRSQLISTPLEYDSTALVNLARDAFVDAKHPMASWFSDAVRKTLEGGFLHRLEVEAMAELEEEASEALLDHATDELRQQLMRRPVRGHTIALIDTVGPKTVSVVVVDPNGKVLASDELPCAVLPEVVNQNVVVLGQLIHKHRVTLVALTNGPVRRFMVATLKELMTQSVGSGLRWTMADRSGAEAYAGGRIGLRELATFNRRERAAIWTARCLQNPLVELLKVDIARLRLGSYQRELPQGTLRQLVLDTIVDCVCSRGLDVKNASENELVYVPGVAADQAKQIVGLASSGQLHSRGALKESVQGWSESGYRQAIGWLRVFESSETALDATLIHPEDYRLAERLIENTSLSAPNAAPPGWVHRSASQHVATTEAVASQPDSTPQQVQPADAESLGVDPVSAESVAVDEASVEAAPVEAASVEAGSGGVNSSAAAATTEDASVADAVAAESSSTDAEGVEASELDSQLASFAAPSASPQAEDVASMPAIAPEYPEDVAAIQPAAPIVDADKLAKEWQVGRAKLKSIAAALQDPFGDPRLEGPVVPMRVDFPALDSLQPDTCVWAIVVGVADFGAFVELAPNCNGLIHISRLSTNFVEDPHQCVQVGDLLMTWVVNIDEKRNRVALTALSPAQRAEVALAAEQRKAQFEQDRMQRGGPRGDSRGDHRGGDHRGGGRGGDRSRSDRPAGAANTAGHRGSGPHPARSSSQGGGSGQGRGPGGGRPSHAGSGQRQGSAARGGDRNDRGRSGNRGRGPGRGDEGGRGSKSVVITSKKPVAPISQAMKQGEEPLRSFSDLLQFYEAQRSPGSEVVSQGPIESAGQMQAPAAGASTVDSSIEQNPAERSE